MTTEKSAVVFMMPGDLHLTHSGLPNHDTAIWAVQEANDFIHPDFVQFIGDNVQDARAEQFHLFKELATGLRCPWYAIIGDHDVKDDPTAAGFRKWIGEPTGSSRLRGFRFVRLNTQEHRPVGFAGEQLRWLRTEVDAAVSVRERVVLFQHHYPFQIWEDYAGPGIDDWRAIVQSRPIHAIFCGHTHYWQVANDGRNVHVATRSIGDPEGGPPGYTIAYMQGKNLAIAYRSIDDCGPLVLITSPRDIMLCTGPEHVVCGNASITARIWSRSQIMDVRGRVDDQPVFHLQNLGTLDWSAPLPVGFLTKGSHQLSVVAENMVSEVGEAKIEFVVDSTGRYTAVPRAEPLVQSTRFC